MQNNIKMEIREGGNWDIYLNIRIIEGCIIDVVLSIAFCNACAEEYGNKYFGKLTISLITEFCIVYLKTECAKAMKVLYTLPISFVSAKIHCFQIDDICVQNKKYYQNSIRDDSTPQPGK